MNNNEQRIVITYTRPVVTKGIFINSERIKSSAAEYSLQPRPHYGTFGPQSCFWRVELLPVSCQEAKATSCAKMVPYFSLLYTRVCPRTASRQLWGARFNKNQRQSQPRRRHVGIGVFTAQKTQSWQRAVEEMELLSHANKSCVSLRGARQSYRH